MFDVMAILESYPVTKELLEVAIDIMNASEVVCYDVITVAN